MARAAMSRISRSVIFLVRAYLLGCVDFAAHHVTGMIASGEDKEIIENLVISHIQKPSCIILLTIACESKWLGPVLLAT